MSEKSFPFCLRIRREKDSIFYKAILKIPGAGSGFVHRMRMKIGTGLNPYLGYKNQQRVRWVVRSNPMRRKHCGG